MMAIHTIRFCKCLIDIKRLSLRLSLLKHPVYEINLRVFDWTLAGPELTFFAFVSFKTFIQRVTQIAVLMTDIGAIIDICIRIVFEESHFLGWFNFLLNCVLEEILCALLESWRLFFFILIDIDGWDHLPLVHRRLWLRSAKHLDCSNALRNFQTFWQLDSWSVNFFVIDLTLILRVSILTKSHSLCLLLWVSL